MPTIGKLLITAGVLLVTVGIIFVLAPQIPWLGRLPGDIKLESEDWTFYFPLTTCVLASIVLTLLLNLIFRLLWK